jgi:hypothetical protein
MSAVISGTNAIGTSGSVSCASGTTAEYQLETLATNVSGGSWSAWSAWSTTLTSTVAASQGYEYGFGTHAHCSGTSIDSAVSATATDTVVRSISTPGAPVYAGASSFSCSGFACTSYGTITYTYNVTTGPCPSGTTLKGTFTDTDWNGGVWGPHGWGYWDSWEGLQGHTEYVSYRGVYTCSTYYYTSATSPTTTTSIPVTVY